MSVLSSIAPWNIYRQLRHGGSAATFNRLLASRHVADLQLIFVVALVVLLVALLFAGAVLVVRVWPILFGGPDAAGGLEAFAFFSAIWGVASGVLAWTYLTGSARLGVVDLFACEISTLCRVMAVGDAAIRLIETYNINSDSDSAASAVPSSAPDLGRFSSEENYMPVFGGYADELKVLDVKVVSNVTQFYTYIKAMRDSLRALTFRKRRQVENIDEEEWHIALRNVIYMLFLALESARRSVRDLIEYEPNEVENTATILLNELPAYRFLCDKFCPKEQGATEADLRYRRLLLRYRQYKHEVADIEVRLSKIMSEGPPPGQDAEEWHSDCLKARENVDEVRRRYKALFPAHDHLAQGHLPRAASDRTAA